MPGPSATSRPLLCGPEPARYQTQLLAGIQKSKDTMGQPDRTDGRREERVGKTGGGAAPSGAEGTWMGHLASDSSSTSTSWYNLQKSLSKAGPQCPHV